MTKRSYKVYVVELQDGSLWCGVTNLIRLSNLRSIGIRKLRKSLAAHLPAFRTPEEARRAHAETVAKLERHFSKYRIPVRS